MCKVSSHKCSSLELQGLTILCKNWYSTVAETGISIAPARWEQSFFSRQALGSPPWCTFQRARGHITKQTYILECICLCAMSWVGVFFTPPLVLELKIQVGEMWKQLGLIHSCCYSFCFHWSYSKAEFSIWWTTCSPKLELRGEGFRDDHATLGLLLKQLKLPQEGWYWWVQIVEFSAAF